MEITFKNLKLLSIAVTALLCFCFFSCGDNDTHEDFEIKGKRDFEIDETSVSPIGKWKIKSSVNNYGGKYKFLWNNGDVITIYDNKKFTVSSEVIGTYHQWEIESELSDTSAIIIFENIQFIVAFKKSNGLWTASVSFPATNQYHVDVAKWEWEKIDDAIWDDTNTEQSQNTSNDSCYEERVTEGQLVNLGLSVRWASCNIGATIPEEHGDYVCWGDPTGEKLWNSTTAPQQYVNQHSICGTMYDYAYIKSNGKLRMPSKAEVQELIDNCTWAHMAYHGVWGYRIIGKNGNAIFLPKSGLRKPYKNSVTGKYKYDKISGVGVMLHCLIGEQFSQTMGYILYIQGGGKKNWIFKEATEYNNIAPWNKYEACPIRPVEL